MSSIPTRDEVHTNQIYVIKFVIDLLQAGNFLELLHFTPPIKLKIFLLSINNLFHRNMSIQMRPSVMEIGKHLWMVVEPHSSFDKSVFKSSFKHQCIHRLD